MYVKGMATCPVLGMGMMSGGFGSASSQPDPTHCGFGTLHQPLHWGLWAAPWDVTVSPFILLRHLLREGRVKSLQFLPSPDPPLTTFYRCLNCWSFVHLVQFIPNDSGSRFSPPLGTPFLSLAAEPDPGASRIEPQEVPTASSRLRIPSWGLNALHQRAVGHHINQEL